jgi:hypothetical protein
MRKKGLISKVTPDFKDWNQSYKKATGNKI